ncbi:MAG: hypothetical protein JXB85_02665 [Anaerolineales bacterium]|nr:hypothetical protein [Anaerolineales bacterium]
MNWDSLPAPWRACLEQAWEAYCEDCIPIGAVVTAADGEILSRGRNRIFERVKPGGGTNGAPLAHAEVEALSVLDYDAIDPHTVQSAVIDFYQPVHVLGGDDELVYPQKSEVFGSSRPESPTKRNFRPGKTQRVVRIERWISRFSPRKSGVR